MGEEEHSTAHDAGWQDVCHSYPASQMWALTATQEPEGLHGSLLLCSSRSRYSFRSDEGNQLDTFRSGPLMISHVFIFTLCYSRSLNLGTSFIKLSQLSSTMFLHLVHPVCSENWQQAENCSQSFACCKKILRDW